jgi:general secretion pathway protein A
MYLDFFGLREKPFNSTPDPRFLFLTPGHREALAQLVYGIRESKGFMVLTGEVGTGKTTLLQALLKRLDPGTAVAYVFDSTLPFDEILEYVLADLGINRPGETRAQRLFALNGFLIERRRSGANTVLIIDEAQNLEPPTLERVRLLSNFESTTEKLLQILLVGQPELEDRLARPELRQLRQRVGLHCTIPPLTAAETRDYLRSRLRIAGARDLGVFSDTAVRRIAGHARGIPRVVNLLADHALLIAYAERQRQVTREAVDQAIAYLDRPMGGRSDGRPAGPGRAARAAWAVRGAALAAAVAGVALLALAEPAPLRTYVADVVDTARHLLGR